MGKGLELEVVEDGRWERDEKVCIIDVAQYNTTIQIHGLKQNWHMWTVTLKAWIWSDVRVWWASKSMDDWV